MLFRSDRKSTRLNSSHTIISYAVFCLKKKTERASTRATAHRHSVRRHHSAGVRSAREGPVPLTVRSVFPLASVSVPAFFFFLKDGAPPDFSPFSPPPHFPF